MKYILIIALVALLLWIRLSPMPPERWHVDPESAPDPGIGGVKTQVKLAAEPQEVMRKLAEVALATDRTRLLAGDVASGHMSFLTRSLVMGFPDVTSVKAEPGEAGGTILWFYGRLRFGRGDLGVNRKRVEGWIEDLTERL